MKLIMFYLLLLLLISPSGGGTLKDVLNEIDRDLTDTIDKADNSYHNVKDKVQAFDKEMKLAEELGPEGVYVLLIIAGVEFVFLVGLTCEWCFDSRH
jgi:hypothetical protein